MIILKPELCPRCNKSLSVEQTDWMRRTYCRECAAYERVETRIGRLVYDRIDPPEASEQIKRL